jgi:hypothetical protein
MNESMDPTTWPDCIDCGDPHGGTCPGDRCRDCDMDYVVSTSSCRECFAWIWSEEWGGAASKQHKPGCSLANEDDFTARDADELKRVRTERCGWSP